MANRHTPQAPEKAQSAQACKTLEQIPNIGFALAADLRSIGIQQPRDLIGRNGFALYLMLCQRTGTRQDPCVLDSFLAACDFMQGADPAPWWHYTPQRKQRYGKALEALFQDSRSPNFDLEEACALYSA